MATNGPSGSMILNWGPVKIDWNPWLQICHASNTDRDVEVQIDGRFVVISDVTGSSKIELKDNGFAIVDEEEYYKEMYDEDGIGDYYEEEEDEDFLEVEQEPKRQRIDANYLQIVISYKGDVISHVENTDKTATVSQSANSGPTADTEDRKRKVAKRDNPGPEETVPVSTEDSPDNSGTAEIENSY